jgi:alcohol dehydrogenase YqhD (iron-dependent ADH family)
MGGAEGGGEFLVQHRRRGDGLAVGIVNCLFNFGEDAIKRFGIFDTTYDGLGSRIKGASEMGGMKE